MSSQAIRRASLIPLALLALSAAAPLPAPIDALPSWRDGTASKRAILEFVAKATTQHGPYFVPPAQRVAVFDNDGTLWAEQPMPIEFFFTLDRVKALAPAHPEWATTEPFASVLKGDIARVLASGEHGVVDLVMATHAGMTTDEFTAIVTDWIRTATHPKTGKLYTRMIYQPMLELLAYLRSKGFKTFIVSGGGIEFMRAWAERVYGVPEEQVIGSSIRTRFEMRNGTPVLVRLSEVNFVDDKAGKPAAIQMHIGQRPVAAVGNSDGDLQMLQWTAAGRGTRLCVVVHHTDAEREWAYDRDFSFSPLDKALEEAKARGWTVVDMKNDWNLVFPFQAK